MVKKKKTQHKTQTRDKDFLFLRSSACTQISERQQDKLCGLSDSGTKPHEQTRTKLHKWAKIKDDTSEAKEQLGDLQMKQVIT